MSAPFGDGRDLPEDLRQLLEELAGPGALEKLRWALSSSTHHGPVNWDLARQAAIQIAAEGDRPPTAEERATAEEAQRVAEHWLEEGDLPAPAEAGRLEVGGRQAWANAALDGLRPVVEPVAAAAIGALATAGEAEAGEGLAGLGIDLAEVGGLEALLAPVGGVLMGLQTGQVVGTLARQVLGQYDLGIPTAEPSTAWRVAVNAADAFEGYALDRTEVTIVLALHEGAHRRQYHAVPWLAAHLHALVARFAAGTEVDTDRLVGFSRELAASIDPEDPASVRDALQRATEFRLEPTPAQRRVLDRLKGLVLLLQAWVRSEVRAAAEPRLPNLARIEEVLRRRRAVHGEGERLLAELLGLDLKPDDEAVGDRFVAEVRAARGTAGLRSALGHPENLPDAGELAEPGRWLERMAAGADVPDDASGLFGDEPPEGR